MFYTPSFWYKTFQKSLPQAPDVDVDVEVNDCVLVLVQVEAEDVEKRKKVTDKLLKNLKWLAGKFESKRVVLHFFPTFRKAGPALNSPARYLKTPRSA